MTFRIPPNELIHTLSFRKLFQSNTWSCPDLVLLVVLDGQVNITIDGQEFSSSAASWYSSAPVTIQSDQEAEVSLLLLDPEALLDFLGSADLLQKPITHFSSGQETVLKTELYHLYQQHTDSRRDTFYLEAASMLNILQVLKDASKDRIRLPEPLSTLSPRRESLFRSLYTYIARNCTSDISQAGTAARFGITPQYLARFLKENTGKTFRALVDSLRSALAADYRRYTSLTEEQIQLHLSPQYQFSEKQEESAAPVPALPGLMSHFQSESANPAAPREVYLDPNSFYIEANLNRQNHSRGFWRRLINLGYAPNLRESTLRETLIKLQQDISFEYGRICQIMQLIQVDTINGHTFYDFAQIFQLLDQLLDFGMTPFLELGNKSLHFHQTADESVTSDTDSDTQEYFSRMESALPAFIKACINYYGVSVVNTWYFEVSYSFTSQFERDRENFSFYQFTREFQKICRIIHQLAPQAKIGGPGYNNWSDRSLMRSSLHLMETQPEKPDFYTVYAYPVVRLDNRMVFSDDPDLLYRRMQTFHEELGKLHCSKEIWITEFNSNLSSQNYLNDSCYQAAFLIRMVDQLQGLHRIHALGYYLLSDQSMRYNENTDPLFGGFGLLTDSHIPKPSYHAYRLLSMLGQYYIKSSHNAIITADSPGHFQILIYRFSQLLGALYARNLTKEDLLAEKQIIRNPGIDHYHIRLANVTPGTYLIQDYQINADHSNIFRNWSLIQFLSSPFGDLQEDLKQLSQMLPAMRIISVEEDGVFTIDAILTDLDVHLLNVTIIQDTAQHEEVTNL